AGEAGAAAAALPACDPDNGGLVLPQGFCALVAHEGVGAARHIAVAPDGRVYVAIQTRRGQEGQTEQGGIVALRDTDGDGRLDERSERFGPEGGTGIAVQDGYLYFAPNTYVVRWRLADGELQPSGEPDTVVSGFPEQRSHAAKPLTFDGRGNMWVTVGAPSNNCGGESDRQRGAQGLRPCPELEQTGGVWRFDANRTGQRQQDGEHWATGLRNALALGFNPADGQLYAGTHGRDQLDVIAPQHFTPQQNAELPAEEFVRLERGDNYSWPYCHYDPRQNRRVLAPEYGGDGQATGDCEQYRAPLTAFPAHWAPQDLLFYTGEQFPERYRGGAFIAWHGSWNRAPEPQQGYKVTFQPMGSGGPAGEYEVFADGFAGNRPLQSPGEAEHRPMGLAQLPDGTLYIVDSQQGRIWRVLYTGAR
ncbi:MAG TPA: PQQ-dependent sugar dehydrogenase, partial [Longimicrobiaceae bacterium]|nr:PQQ-dependent sugar dehydrogenase [Longimicrobiaceae bacterium]